MSSIKAWVKDLNISESQYQEWLANVGDISQITAWTILSGHLEEQKYLTWARDHFGLCSLSDNFFTENTVPPIWEKVKSLPYWSSQFVPIHEWNGTLFVACVEPQTSINWGFSVQYILASPAQLQNYWMKLNSVTPTQTNPAEEKSPTNKPPLTEENSQLAPEKNPFSIPTAPEAPEDDFAKQLEALNGISDTNRGSQSPDYDSPEPTVVGENNLAHLDGQSFEDLPPTPDIQLQTATNIEALPTEKLQREESNPLSSSDGLEGLNLNLATPSRNDSNDPTALFNQEMSLDVENDSPEGLSLETKTNISNEGPTPQVQGLSTEPEAPQGLSFDSQGPTAQVIEQPLQVKHEATESTQIPDGLLNTKTAISVGAAVNNPSSEPQTETMTPPNNPSMDHNNDTPIAESATTSEPKINEEEPTIIIENAPIDIGQAKSERDVVAFFFKQLRQEYTKTMALIFKGTELHPWYWDNTWTHVAPETKKIPVDLEAASVFRIVHRTKMPYHGYVVESDVNKKFFNDWGMDQLPGSLTLIPLSQSGYLFGMLLCVGEADKNSNFVLSFAEKIAEQFLDKISNSSKAA